MSKKIYMGKLDAKSELEKLLVKITDPNNSLSEIVNLKAEIEKLLEKIQAKKTEENEKLSPEEKELIKRIGHSFRFKIDKFIEEWKEGLFEPKGEEITFLKEWTGFEELKDSYLILKPLFEEKNNEDNSEAHHAALQKTRKTGWLGVPGWGIALIVLLTITVIGLTISLIKSKKK